MIASEHRYPVVDRASYVIPRHSYQGMIEHRLPDRFRADEEEMVEVGIYAVCQGKVHQHGAVDGGPYAVARQHNAQPAGFIVEHQQQDFLADRQH